MDDACMYYFEPKTDVECVYLNDFHKPSTDVEPGTDDSIILSLRLIFISIGRMFYFCFHCLDAEKFECKLVAVPRP